MKPKAKAEAIKQIHAPVSLFDKLELIAKIIPIHPVMKALIVADNLISQAIDALLSDSISSYSVNLLQ